MSFLKANCPNCAGPIEFKKGSSIVIVCPFCRSAVARTDRKLEDLGRVAEIVDSRSPLKLGLRGDYKGNKFELTGRAQIKHGAGGFWDEWYATFSNGWVGWLAEAQGKFYMTFYKPLPEGFQVPTFNEIKPGQRLDGVSDETHLIVNEKGTATYIAADGEIPYKLNPNEQSNYADLVGKDGVFATIDYSTDPPYLFYGKELTLADMGLEDKRPAEREAKVVSAEAVSCPNCGGTLELKAPDKSERVTCQSCSSLLSAENGNLKYLKTLQSTKAAIDFSIPIGAKGSFENYANAENLEVIGAMIRSVHIDSITYYWDEYLLYNPNVGFKWLVQSDSHWSFVDSVSSGDIQDSSDDESGLTFDPENNTSIINYNEIDFHLFQTADATVEYVKGEFYWAVEQGEKVRAADFVAPPFMLSKEMTAKEINWSLGTYVERADVEKAFGISNLRSNFIIAPNQPFIFNSLIRSSLIVLAAFFLTIILFSLFTGGKNEPKDDTDVEQIISISPLDSADSKVEFFSEPFYLKKDNNVSINVITYLNYEESAEFKATLVPANTNTNKNDTKIISVEPAKKYDYSNDILKNKDTTREVFENSYKSTYVKTSGEYQVSLKGNWKKWDEPMYLQLDINQYRYYDYSSYMLTILLFLLLLAVPIVLMIYKYNFEQRRWGESDFPYSKGFGDIISEIFSGK